MNLSKFSMIVLSLLLCACEPINEPETESICITYNGVMGPTPDCRTLQEWIASFDKAINATDCSAVERNAAFWKATYGEEPKYWAPLNECRKNTYAEPGEKNGRLGWYVDNLSTPYPDKMFCETLPCPQ